MSNARENLRAEIDKLVVSEQAKRTLRECVQYISQDHAEEIWRDWRRSKKSSIWLIDRLWSALS